MSKIVIIDDHDIVCEGVAVIVRKFLPNYEVIKRYDLKDMHQILAENDVRLIILDIHIPDNNPMGFLKELKQKKSIVPVLMLTAFKEIVLAQSFYEAGAKGYIQKNEKPEELAQAIQTILDGHLYMSNALRNIMLDRSLTYAFSQKEEKTLLGVKDVEFLTLMKNGYNIREIAEKMHTSIPNAYKIKKKIFNKLHIRNELELAQFLEKMFMGIH